MHCHTTHSDGGFSLKEVIEKAKEKKIDYLFITDHDTLEARTEDLQDDELKVIVGVEVSSYYKGESVHILGYFYGEPSNEIIDYFKVMKISREERAKEMIRRLDEYFNIKVSYDEIKKYVKGIIARPHIAKEVASKYGITENEVFIRYLNKHSKAYVPSSKLSTQDAIDLLHRNNAIAVWAHPVLNKGRFAEEEIIEMGIDGIEGLYPKNSMNDTIKYRDLTIEHNLLFTAGSDFHGDEDHANIGTCFIEDEDINKFFKYLDTKKG